MKRMLSLLLVLCMLMSLLTVSVFADDSEEEAIPDGYYLIGSHNNWDVTQLKDSDCFRQSQGANTDEYILETTLTEGQNFKVVYVENSAFKTWYPDGMNNNYTVDANHAGARILYFNPAGNQDWNSGNGYAGFVWVGEKPAIPYIDENGELQSCTEYTTANYAGGTWTGWIVVNEDTYVNARVQVEGSAHVILPDGKTITTRGGVHVSNGNSISFYGQENNTGKLNAILSGDDLGFLLEIGERRWSWHAAIGTNARNAQFNPDEYDETPGPIVINGGTFNLQGFNAPAIGVSDTRIDTPDITINGGIVNAATTKPGSSYMSAAIGSGASDPRFQTTGSVTINGGEVHATGLIGIGDVAGGSTKITINGGIVESTGMGARTDAIYPTDVTINGGVVTLHPAQKSDPYPATTLGNSPLPTNPAASIKINGGQVTVEDSIGGDNCGIVLGWTEDSDFIQTKGYSSDVTLEKDFVNAADETEIFEAGAVQDVSVLANKKLVPYQPASDTPVYMPNMQLFPSISVLAEMVTWFTFLDNCVEPYESYYIEINKLDADGNVTDTLRFGDGQDGAVNVLGNGVSGFSYTKIAAKEMGVRFAATIHAFDQNNREYYGPTETLSIRSYLLDELLDTRNEDDQRKMYADMLNYGAAAQKFFNYDTTNLVNENLSEEEQSAMEQFATTGEAEAAKVNSVNGPVIYRSISFKNRIVAALTLNGIDTSGEVKVLMQRSEDGTLRSELETTKQGSLYFAEITDLELREMRTSFEFIVQIDGVDYGSPCIWSVEGYVLECRQHPSSTEVERNLMNAMLIYADSAAAVFHYK